MPLNIKFVIEGEEEIGCPNFRSFVEQHGNLLNADLVVISDGSMLGPDRPSICYGLRGGFTIKVTLHGPNRDLHSGEYGGAVHNPIHVLSEIIASLHNADNTVALPGFYDAVRPVESKAGYIPRSLLR
jgi:acetylornithine deacetylase/succinyl-diaminopimelate desuccinylase-like protein